VRYLSIGLFLLFCYASSGIAGNDPSQRAAGIIPDFFPQSLTQETISPDGKSKNWQEPLSGMAFVWVDGGCFKMGCGIWDIDCRSREQPEHEVCVDGFWIGKFEVTQGEWKKLLGCNPALNKLSDRHPVDRISWLDTQDIIERLNSRKYGLRFRLPTEAEWEFAARGRGRPESFAGGNSADEAAWHLNNSGDVPKAVGTKPANILGIHDMSGNVREWVEDWYDPLYYQISPAHNPQGPDTGTMRVTRGGSWNSSAHSVRTVNRTWNDPTSRFAGYGVRLVAVPFP